MSTLAGDFWVCGDCRSINNAGANQCYNCRTPRDVAAVDPAQIDPRRPTPARSADLPAFRSSRWVAALASALILALATMQVIQTVATSTLYLRMLDGTAATAEQSRFVANLVVLTLGVAALALIGWALWLSRTVTSMPALGLGQPSVSGLMAFFENFVPLLNLVWVPSIIRDIVTRLAARASRIHVLGFAAWVGLLAGFVVPRISRFILDRGGDPSDAAIRSQLLLDTLGTIVVVVSAIFLVALIWWVEERVQRHREAQAGGADPTVRDAGPARPTPRPQAEPDIVQQRPVFAATGTAWAAQTATASQAPARTTAPSSAPVAAVAIPVVPEPAPVLAGSAVAVTAGSAAPRVSTGAESPGAAAMPLAEAASAGSPTPDAVAAPGPDPSEPVPAATAPEPLAAVPAVADATTEPAAAEVVAAPPHLRIRVASRGMMTAELDGQTEHVILDDLTAYGAALTNAGGTADIVVQQDDDMAQLVARRAVRILEDAGVSVTTDGGR